MRSDNRALGLGAQEGRSHQGGVRRGRVHLRRGARLQAGVYPGPARGEGCEPPLPFLGDSEEEDGARLTEFSTRWLPASDAREIVFLGPAKMDAVAAVVQRFPQPKYFVDEKGDKCVDGWQEVQEAYTVLNALKDYITVESYENLRVRFCSYALKRLLKIQRKTLSLLNEAAMESVFKK